MNFNTSFLKTVCGLLKIAEWVLIIVLVLILRFGNPYYGGSHDAQLLVFGTIVGYSIIVSSIIFNYLTGASVSFLELIINTLAIILFIAVGGVSLEYKGNLPLPHDYQSDSVAIG